MKKFFNAVAKLALAVLVITAVIPLTPPVVKAAANWDTTGSYVFRFDYGGSDYDHDVTLVQDSSGNLTGSGTHAAYAWTIVSGDVTDDNITFTANYTATADAVTPLTTMQVTGTITTGGSMSGTWTDNYLGGSRQGTWETVQGEANLPTNIIVVSGDTSAGENQPGWMFNRDVSTSTPFSFNSGNASIGTGSLEVPSIGANPSDKMIAENFINKPIADVDTISFDFKLGTGNENREEQVYMSLYANFAASDPLKFYDCRYNVLATVGSTSGYETVTFDPTIAPYSVDERVDSPATCPAIPVDMGAGANLRMFALTMGDTSASDAGMSGYFDNVIVKTNEGTTIYDFEPAPQPVPTVVNIQKVWQDSNGQDVHAPSNATDITITVTTENGNDDECTYDTNGDFDCDGTINSYTDETIEVEETGVPAGWTVDPATVGKDITPVCPQVDGDDVQGAVECTHTVINKQNLPAPCATNIVLNGGLEAPNVTDGAKWDVYPSGTTGLGWSVEWLNNVGGDQPEKGNAEIHKDGVVSGWAAHGGDQYTELDSDWGGPGDSQTGENASVKIYQDLITKVGGNYTVSFWAAPRPGQTAADNAIKVLVSDVNGNLVNQTVNNTSTVNNTLNWSHYTYTFEATSGITRLEFSDAGAGNSFGGFLDDVSVVEDCLSDVQICKYNVDQTPLPGWSVFLKGPKIETVDVDSIDNSLYYSSELEAGKYVLEAHGAYVYRAGGYETDALYSQRLPSDAVYSLANPVPWVNVNLFPGGSAGNLGVKVNGSAALWGNTFNSSHDYSGTVTLSADSKLDFQIIDDYYGDNRGEISVDIYPIYEGVTGKDGCVTIEDIPFEGQGTQYTLGEVMQDGWRNVSGNDEKVTVDGIEDSFSLVNECTGDNCVIPCSEFNLGFSDGYVAAGTAQGDRQDHGSVLPSRSNPYLAVGAADWVSGTTTNFYSLGFGGTITLSFTGYVNNVPGDDLNIHEATNGTYPDETASVEVSQDGIVWEPVTTVAGRGITGIDFGSTGLDWIKFVRLTDTSVRGDFPKDADGFDLDAVEAVTETCEPPVIEEPCVEKPIALVSGEDTVFIGIKQGGSAPADLNDESQYPDGIEGSAVIVNPTGYPGAWTAENDPNLVGAQWVSNDIIQPTNSGTGIYNGTEDSWRLFKHEFTIPAGANDISDPVTLYYSADNAVTVFLDDNEIGTTGDMDAIPGNPQHYQNAYSAVLIPALTPGPHTLEFAVRNAADSLPNNPTGLMYKLDTITYDCDQPTPPCFRYDFAPGLSLGIAALKSIFNAKGPQCYTISGNVYHDKNDDGDQDLEQPNPSDDDNGLAGWKVYIDANGNDIHDSDFEPSTTTDSSGHYIITDLGPGCYTVREELLNGSWAQGQEPSDGEYKIGVGGATCGVDDGDEEIPSSITSFLFKTAQAALVSNFPGDADGIDFGNVAISNGSGSGITSSGSGSRTLISQTPLNPQVLGETTTIPSDPGQVAGAATTLPRTGMPTWALLMVALLAFPAFGFKALAVKKASK